jgi:hypothetical protein
MKLKIKISGVTYEVNQDLWEKIKQMKEQNLTEVKINQKTFKLKDIEIVDKTLIDELIDWSAVEYNEIPEEKKVVSDEKATANTTKIKEQIRQMLKEKNKDWKPVYRDDVQKEAVADVWEHLKSEISKISYPSFDLTWDENPAISHHTEGKENHSVIYKTKKIDLGDSYDDKFWCEANYVWCGECKAYIRKQIVIFNDYESECLVKNL